MRRQSNAFKGFVLRALYLEILDRCASVMIFCDLWVFRYAFVSSYTIRVCLHNVLSQLHSEFGLVKMGTRLLI
jgi:hypothetical protein